MGERLEQGFRMRQGAKSTQTAWDALRQFVSSHNKLADLANSWKVLLGELVIKIQQLHLQILEIHTLRPMIWVCVQITQKLAIGFAPVGERLGVMNKCHLVWYPCMLST